MTRVTTNAAGATSGDGPPQDSLERRAALHALRMANRYIKTRNWAMAITWLHQAAEIQPEFFEAYLLLGVVHLEKGELKEAVTAYEKAIELKPEDPTPHLKLGHALIALGDWNGALRQYHALRSLNEVTANDLFDKIIYSFNYEMFGSLFNRTQ